MESRKAGGKRITSSYRLFPVLVARVADKQGRNTSICWRGFGGGTSLTCACIAKRSESKQSAKANFPHGEKISVRSEAEHSSRGCVGFAKTNGEKHEADRVE
jgi:hypothetical protein